MREIKFRAWDGLRMTTTGISFNNSYGILEHPKQPGWKLMQYTGLKDCSVPQKEIYEGDIISIDGGAEPYIAKVYFDKGCFGIIMDNKENLFVELRYYIDMPFCTTEVIGNQYENEEMLNGTNT